MTALDVGVATGPLPAYFATLGTPRQAPTTVWPEADVGRLVDRARDGDREARQVLYVQYVDRVFRTVRGVVQSDADAEDITQDALLTVLTSLHRYTPQADASFTGWVMTIALNTARRRFRRKRPELTPTGDLPDRPAEGVDVDADIDRARRRQALLTALAELPDRERAAVSLRYGAELNATEIGSTLGMTPAAVRKLLERTRVRLAARLLSPTDTRSDDHV